MTVDPGDEFRNPPAAGESVDSDDVVDDGQITDVLPADLDATLAVAIEFPNNNRRRIPAFIYLVLGGAAFVASVTSDSSVSVNRGLATAGLLLVAFALYGMVAGRTLRIDERDALGAASAEVGFPIGHASAQLAWRGLLSRPVWRLLVYSAEDPPLQRGMVIVDGVSGSVVEWFTEANPEQWQRLTSAYVLGDSGLGLLAASVEVGVDVVRGTS